MLISVSDARALAAELNRAADETEDHMSTHMVNARTMEGKPIVKFYVRIDPEQADRLHEQLKTRRGLRKPAPSMRELAAMASATLPKPPPLRDLLEFPAAHGSWPAQKKKKEKRTVISHGGCK